MLLVVMLLFREVVLFMVVVAATVLDELWEPILCRTLTHTPSGATLGNSSLQLVLFQATTLFWSTHEVLNFFFIG